MTKKIRVKNSDWHTKTVQIKDNRFISRYNKRIPTFAAMCRLAAKI